MLLCFVVQAKANDGHAYVSHGGVTLRDGKNSAIRMDSEYVEIKLYKDYYTVDATFWLFNMGKKKTVYVAFPHTVDSRYSIYFDSANFIKALKDNEPVAYENLRTSVNDSNVEYQTYYEYDWELYVNEKEPLTTIKSVNQWWKNTGKYLTDDVRYVVFNENWLIWCVKSVKFPTIRTTKTFVGFQSEYEYTDEDKSGKYIFGSGNSWKDSIIKSVFLIKKCTQDSSILTVNISEEYEKKGIVKRQKSDNEEVLEFTNFKPDSWDEIEFILEEKQTGNKL